MTPKLLRTPLRADLYGHLLTSLLEGRFQPGDRVQDTKVAEEFGVSRTPVREALFRLEREGFLLSLPGRGFRVQPFRKEEVQQLYPLVGLLEAWGLSQGGSPPSETLKELEDLRRRIQDPATDPDERHRLDLRWHEQLLEPCGNSHLKRLIADLKVLLHRYELAYMATPVLLEASADDHLLILQDLAAGKVDTAAATLEHHWIRSMDALMPFLATQGESTPVPEGR